MSMKLFRNLFTLLKVFIIFFIIFFCVYLFRIVDTNSLLKDFDLKLLKRFVDEYNFYIFVAASLISIIFIGTLNKFRGYIPSAITIGILSAIIISYPVYILIGKQNIEYLKNENTYFNINEKTFTKVDKYIIKANNKLLNNAYKNAILIDSVFSNKIYFADSVYVSNRVITLYDVKEINGNGIESKDSVIIERNSLFSYLSDISKDIIFGFNLIPFLSLSLKYVTVDNPQIYPILILYSQFFLIFISLYTLGLSFCSKKYMYHNILTAFLIYGLVQIIFTLANRIMHNLNFWNITAFIYFISVFIIMLSFILKRILKN